MKVTEKDLIGELKGFPLEVVQRMLEEQARQLGKIDIGVFQKDSYADSSGGGFSWYGSEAGVDFWEKVIVQKDFSHFFAKYPANTKVKIINKSKHKLPEYETKGSAGMDIRSTEGFEMMPGERHLFKTGLFLELPIGMEAQVRPRSGLAIKHGITVLNSPGTIDSDYRSEVGVILINHSSVPFIVEEGDRIAQMVFAKVDQVELVEVEELSKTERGQGGFGSTGVK